MDVNLEGEKDDCDDIFDFAPVGLIIVDETERISRVNDAAMAFLKGERELFIGKTFRDAFFCEEDLYDNKVCCQGRACKNYNIKEAIQLAITSGQSMTDIEFSRKFCTDGEIKELWFKANISPMKKGNRNNAVIVIMDITDIKVKEFSLEQSRDFYLRIFGNLPFMIWKMDIEGKGVFLNQRWAEFTGQPIEKGLELGWVNFIHPEDRDRCYEIHVKSVKKRLPYETEYRFLHKDGEYRWVQSFNVPFCNVNGEFDGYIGISLDINVRKKVEEEQKVYRHLSEEAKRAAEEANKAKSEFLANMSHEIRTPINGIIGMVDLTLCTDLNGEQKENLMIVKSNANSLLKIINDILDFSKMEARKLDIENINFDMKELVEKTVKSHSAHAMEKGLELTYAFSSMIPKYLVGDPNRIQQILNNLINNAIRFTERGEILIKTKKIKNVNSDIEIQFSVEDSGIGISEKNAERIFESFHQVDGSFTRRFGGTGLGLPISKQLVELMGGRLWLESKVGSGSTFYFTLKLKIGSSMENQLEKFNRDNKINSSYSILVAEDDEVNQMVITRILKGQGCTVDIVNNGLKAIEMHAEKSYDVILMDIQMPELDGIEAAKKIREKDKHVPIIVVTAYALKGDRERFLSLGVDEYISKPIKVEDLFSAINRCMQLRKFSGDLQDIGISVDDSGNAMFRKKDVSKPNQIELSLVDELSYAVRNLEEALNRNKVELIELFANKIKNLSYEIGLEELKTISFKMQLAARREDYNKVIDTVKEVKHMLQMLKKSI